MLFFGGVDGLDPTHSAHSNRIPSKKRVGEALLLLRIFEPSHCLHVISLAHWGWYVGVTTCWFSGESSQDFVLGQQPWLAFVPSVGLCSKWPFRGL